MTTLLVGTLVLAGTHTALWLPRSLKDRRTAARESSRGSGVYVRRFRPSSATCT